MKYIILFYILISILSIGIGILLLLLADDRLALKPSGFLAKFFSTYFGYQFIILPYVVFKDSIK